MPAVLNAANEMAVAAFLAGELGYIEIAAVLRSAMERHTPQPVSGIEVVEEADRATRIFSGELIGRLSEKHKGAHERGK
jgi:1-deoxy-D-xylulose-5-phosphate reductoisomerase